LRGKYRFMGFAVMRFVRFGGTEIDGDDVEHPRGRIRCDEFLPRLILGTRDGLEAGIALALHGEVGIENAVIIVAGEDAHLSRERRQPFEALPVTPRVAAGEIESARSFDAEKEEVSGEKIAALLQSDAVPGVPGGVEHFDPEIPHLDALAVVESLPHETAGGVLVEGVRNTEGLGESVARAAMVRVGVGIDDEQRPQSACADAVLQRGRLILHGVDNEALPGARAAHDVGAAGGGSLDFYGHGERGYHGPGHSKWPSRPGGFRASTAARSHTESTDQSFRRLVFPARSLRAPIGGSPGVGDPFSRRYTMRRMLLAAMALIAVATPALAEVSVGDKAPAFDVKEMINISGLSPRDLDGRVVMVDVFRTW
jgi:hypothetical protein